MQQEHQTFMFTKTQYSLCIMGDFYMRIPALFFLLKKAHIIKIVSGYKKMDINHSSWK